MFYIFQKKKKALPKNVVFKSFQIAVSSYWVVLEI